MMDFRPISLCNVSYKLLSKIIANRLKKVMAQVIDESQSAFVKDRLITDNIIVAIEAFHWLKTGMGFSHSNAYALKIDMSKVYDRVEWGYLRWILTWLNFPCRLIDLIMQCVSTVNFQVLINGIPSQSFDLLREFVKGTLSPPIYSFYVRRVSHLLYIRLCGGDLGMVPKWDRFFADDSLLFMEDKERVPMLSLMF